MNREDVTHYNHGFSTGGGNTGSDIFPAVQRQAIWLDDGFESHTLQFTGHIHVHFQGIIYYHTGGPLNGVPEYEDYTTCPVIHTTIDGEPFDSQPHPTYGYYQRTSSHTSHINPKIDVWVTNGPWVGKAMYYIDTIDLSLKP